MLPFTKAWGMNLEGEIRPLNKRQEEGTGRGGGREWSEDTTFSFKFWILNVQWSY